MAVNRIYVGDPRENREAEVGADIVSGTPVLIEDGRPAVTLTASGGTVGSSLTPQGYTLSGYDIGGVGNRENFATVAVNGTYEFPVTGGLVDTAQGTEVFIDATAHTLSLTGTDHYGYVDLPPDYFVTAGVLPVRIGA